MTADYIFNSCSSQNPAKDSDSGFDWIAKKCTCFACFFAASNFLPSATVAASLILAKIQRSLAPVSKISLAGDTRGAGVKFQKS